MSKPFNPYSVRWHPDFRWQSEKIYECSLALPIDNSESITDKESYRVTLASLRGELAQGIGSPSAGSYSIPSGQDYDPNKDFSILNRPDLTIVQLDEFIDYYKSNLNDYDSDLKKQVETELAKAESLKAAKMKTESDKGGDE